MKRYNLINNALGWLCFAVAAVTYLLTVEPTASFWDCPEFIAQGFKLEIGHPPGNPIFMLTARFFVTLFGGSAQTAALAVNSMSALLSAGTILLLFWTITHLARKLVVRDNAQEISWLQTLVIMGAGLCGALVYTWSDTFWFSAVEGEVYAFSSFCTALVFWLILKWENRADEPHSDRYLVLIAYVIGVSIAVHLLNLLCIPAIGLVFYYKKFANPTVKGSFIALGISAAIIALILFGLVPGFIAVAQRFELFFVNVCGLGYNWGVLIYAVLTVATFIWTVYELYRQKSPTLIKIGFLASIIMSGMPFIGHGWVVPTLLIIAMIVWLFAFCPKVPVRIFNVIVLSVFVIFIGYSSYALILIRSAADTPMNQNAPDNVFDLASYLSREQYGDTPLLYGPLAAEELPESYPVAQDESGNYIYGWEVNEKGLPDLTPLNPYYYEGGAPVDEVTYGYKKVVKNSPDEPDQYVKKSEMHNYKSASDASAIFTRMYSTDPTHFRGYKSWSEYENPDFEKIPAGNLQTWRSRGYVTEAELFPYLNHIESFDVGERTDQSGSLVTPTGWSLGYGTNLRYFLNYQLNHMYWRYFMWNFAGRQNDIAGNGEPHLGNWISGIPFIDNLRLGDQSALPDEFGSGNAGHNVFYMLPLLLGLIGLLWQSLYSKFADPKRGIEQFWVVFFLFFMTGIAIVLYLNQPPGQPRERDYAFAGSFYAFAIWVGLGVPAIAAVLRGLIEKFAKKEADATWAKVVPVAVALVFAVGVPLQMVSQTWDDHDRSGRYTTRDFGSNYLNSLDPNAIIFTNGDNDTFPLWYAQEVEGVRTDVKVVNLSYLATDWYVNQVRQPSYDAAGVPMTMQPQTYAYGDFWAVHAPFRAGLVAYANTDDPATIAELNSIADQCLDSVTGKTALDALYYGSPLVQDVRKAYTMVGQSDLGNHVLPYNNIFVPIDSAATKAAFGMYPNMVIDGMGAVMDMKGGAFPTQAGLSKTLTFDIVANSAADGWKRPVYFATTVPDSYYLGFKDGMYATGMAYQVTPFYHSNAYLQTSPVVEKAYANIMGKWQWGNLDSGKKIYLDETVRRMVSSTRLAVLQIVDNLLAEPKHAASAWAVKYAKEHNMPVPRNYADMARALLTRMDSKMPASVAPYESHLDLSMADEYVKLWIITGNNADAQKARAFADIATDRYAQLVRYADTLTPGWRSRLGSAEKQALRFYLTQALAVNNFIDLRQALISKKAPAEDLKTLDATFDLFDNILVNSWLYRGLSEGQLEDYAQVPQYQQDVYIYNYLATMHNQYGVDRFARTDAQLKKIGITRDRFTQLSY